MTEDFTSAGQGYAWTGKSTMTDLERVRKALRAYSEEYGAEDELADLDAHLREDAEREEALKALNEANDLVRKMCRDGLAEKEAELAELREAVRAWTEASDDWLNAAEARPYDPEAAAYTSIERRKTEDRLRQLIKEKE